MTAAVSLQRAGVWAFLLNGNIDIVGILLETELDIAAGYIRLISLRNKSGGYEDGKTDSA